MPIDTYRKILIILVLLGEKKASDLTFPDSIDGARVKTILQNLRKIGLQADVIRTDTKRRNMAIGVSQSKAIIEELKILNPDKDHRRFGELMGFPGSAVDAFTGENGAEKATAEAQFAAIKDLPRPRDFPYFAFSKNGMSLELEKVKRWVNLIREYAPELLEQPK